MTIVYILLNKLIYFIKCGFDLICKMTSLFFSHRVISILKSIIDVLSVRSLVRIHEVYRKQTKEVYNLIHYILIVEEVEEVVLEEDTVKVFLVKLIDDIPYNHQILL